MVEFFYNIHDFEPPVNGLRSGGFGFSVELKESFARRALDLELSESVKEGFQKRSRSIIKSFGWKGEVGIKSHYNFVTNEEGLTTGLLHYIRVPGTNTCNLGFELNLVESLRNGSLTSPFYYNSHNVDTIHQASALLSLWLTWAKTLESMLRE